MNFIPRYTPQDSPQDPIDLAAVHADDALIEMLRSGGLTSPSRHLLPGFEQAAESQQDDPTRDADNADLFDIGPAASRTPFGEHSFDHNSDNPGAAETGVTGFSESGSDFSDTGRHRIRSTIESDNSDDAVTTLLQAWREELRAVPLPPPISVNEAVAIVRSAPKPRRSVRPMMAIAVAIFALLMGSAAVGSRSATPEDLLWPVTQLLWSDRADSVIAGRDAREGLNSASDAIMAGHPEAAVVALEQVTVILTRVQEQDGRVTLESDYNRVSEQLENLTTHPGEPTTTPPQPTLQPSTNTTSAPAGPTSVPAVPVSPSVVAPSATSPAVPPTKVPTTTTTPVAPQAPSDPSIPPSPPATPEATAPVDASTPPTTSTDVTTEATSTSTETTASSPAAETAGDTPVGQAGNQEKQNREQQADEQGAEASN